MKINLSRALKTVANAAKKNPEIALAVVGLVAPGLARKAAPYVVAAVRK
jgi:hypothetical protein